MNCDIRENFNKNTKGFFSYQNEATLPEAAMLLAYGALIEPAVFSSYLETYSTSLWHREVIKLAQKLYSNYPIKDSMLIVTLSIRQERVRVPIEGFIYAKTESTLNCKLRKLHINVNKKLGIPYYINKPKSYILNKR